MKQDIDVIPGQHYLSLNFDAGYYQEREGTKATMEAVIRASWEEGDRVSVINVTNGKLLGGQLVAQSSGHSTTFSGTVSGTLTAGDKIVYVYPAIKNNADEEAFSESLQDLSIQSYSPSTNAVTFYGYSEDTYSESTFSKSITFTLASSYVHLNMSGLTTSMPVTNVTVSNINGGFKWAVEDGDFTIKPGLPGSGINVSCTDITSSSASGNAVIRFAVPASEAADGRTLSVNNTLSTSYTAAERKSASYYNQLYANWQNKVTVTPATASEPTSVVINDSSTESVSASLKTSDAFASGKSTAIQVGGLGTITFDATATDKIRSNATEESATNIFFKVENITEKITHSDNEVVYEVTMKTVDESGSEVFSETKAAGTATVIVPLPEAQATPKPKVYLSIGGVKGPAIDDSKVNFNDGILSFTVDHFSEYAVEYTKYSEYVAIIGNRKYHTLESAITAAGSGNTVKLLKDISITSAIIINKNLTLNLDGHTITCSVSAGRPLLVASNTSLTIKDGVYADGAAGASYGAIDTRISGTAQENVTISISNVDFGVFDSEGSCSSPFNTDNGAIVKFRSTGVCSLTNVRVGTNHYVFDHLGEVATTVTGGKFIVNHDDSDGCKEQPSVFSLLGTDDIFTNVEVQATNCITCLIGASSTLTNCTMSNTKYAVTAAYGDEISINGGSYTGGEDAVRVMTSGGTINISEGTFTGTSNALFANVATSKYPSAVATINVFGGKIKGNMTTSSSPCYINLYGGIYSVDPSTTNATTAFGYSKGANNDPQTSAEYPWKVQTGSPSDSELCIAKTGVPTVYCSLATFRDATNAGMTFKDYTITLLKDIDLNNAEWTPISNYAYGKGSDRLFAGTFDGGEHTISNLKISANTTDVLGNTSDIANGFFGQVATCTIKNLKFVNANVSGAGLNAIVASLHTVSTGKLLMKNVQVLSGSVTNTSNAGGLMSFSTGWTDFEDCVNYASVSGSGPGGIVGMLRDDTAKNTCTIKNCTNHGAITNTYGNGSGAGGIVSKINNSGSIINCKNYGAVSGTVGNVYAGGIIGLANPNNKTFTISDCTNYVSISSNEGEYGRAGGIIGSFGGSLTISKCVNTGVITGYQGAGGINGWNGDSWGLVDEYCYNSGAVTCSNGTNAGGIEQGNINQTVKYSLNYGSVTCQSGTAWQISNSSSTITSCYYYDGSTLKDNSGTEADTDAALSAMNTGLVTPFWGKDNGIIKPLVLIP